MFRNYLLASTLLSFGAVFCGATALAQDAASGEDETARLDTITVTSQKREQDVQTVPVAITAITGSFLEQSQTTGFEELERLVPSLTFQTGASSRDGTVAIRGFGTAGRNGELDPSVGLFVDGVFMDRTGNGVGDFIDIERVEVLRGPQGTLFGKNTPAGIVHFITRDPEFAPSGEIRASFGNFNEVKTSGTFTGPIAGNTVAGRFSFFTNNRDGIYENTITGNDLRDRNRWGVRGKVLIEASENFSMILSADYGEEDEFGPGGDRLETPFDFTLSHNTDGVTEATRWGASAELNWDVGEHTLTSITAYRSYEFFRNQDADFSAADIIPVLQSNPDQEHFTQEIRLASPADKNFDYILGAFYFDKEQTNNLSTLLGADGFGGALDGQGEARTSEFLNTAWAVFAHGNYRFADDQFNLFAGLRFTDEEKTQNDVSELVGPLAFLVFNQWDLAETFDDQVVTWTAGLQYFPQEDWMIYGSVATGYKSGGTSAPALRFDPPRQSVFDPETSTNYELGLKSTFWDGRARLNAAVFLTEFEDFQASQFDAATDAQILTNAGELRSTGIELDGFLRPIDSLTITASVAYIDATYEDFAGAVANAFQQNLFATNPSAPNPGFDPISGTQDLSGQPLPNSPEWTTSLTARYEKPVTENLTGFIQGEGFYRSEVFLNTDLDPNLQQDAYTLVNLRLGVEADNWSATLFANNVFDEEYLIFGGDIPGFGGGGYYAYAGDPQTYGVQLGVKF